MGAINDSIMAVSAVSEMDCQPYIEILEKTNQQLSLWSNPYGLMVAVLTILVALLAFGLTIFIFFAGRDFKERTKEMVESARLKTEGQQKLIEEQIKRGVEEIEKIKGKELVRQLAKKQVEIEKNKARFSIPKSYVIQSQTLNFLYWYSEDGIRYTFPSDDVFNSWFPPSGFRPVILRLTDEQIASITLGGNIIYKAGSRIIKKEGDSKMYAVGLNGFIHHMSSEELAEEIFGADWKTILVTIPDALFINYSVGDSIKQREDFLPQRLMLLAKLP